MTKHSKIAVILLNWNGLNDTLECIASVQESNYEDYEIIVADNNSSDDSIKTIKSKHPEVILIENEDNLGYSGGNNRAMAYALEGGYDYIFLLNNDTVINSDCLKNLVRHYSYSQEDAILGCKVCYYNDKDKISHYGLKWNAQKLKFHKVALDAPATSINDTVEVDQVIGCSIFFSCNLLKQVGLFEEKFFLNYEETDWCFRAKAKGFKIYSVPDALVYHKVSASFKGSSHSSYFLSRNRLLWIKRNFDRKTRLKFFVEQDIPKFIKTLIKLPLRIIGIPFVFISNSPALQHNIDRIFENISSSVGVIHYYLNRFGNCPDYILKLASFRKYFLNDKNTAPMN